MPKQDACSMETLHIALSPQTLAQIKVIEQYQGRPRSEVIRYLLAKAIADTLPVAMEWQRASQAHPAGIPALKPAGCNKKAASDIRSGLDKF